MAARGDPPRSTAMVSRWRRRRMCLLVADAPSPAALRSISGADAVLETSARPPLGARVTLRHPEAGSIAGEVSAIHPDGVALRLAGDAGAIGFALAAIGADMSAPPGPRAA